MNEKKFRERRVVEKLRDLWPSFPQGEIQDGESPDFTVDTPDGTRVGIEVTTYHRPREGNRGLPVEQESLRWRVAKQLAKEVNNAQIPSVYACLLFNENYPLTKERPRR